MYISTVIDSARNVLMAADPCAKVSAAHQMYTQWEKNELTLPELEESCANSKTPDMPGRPERPLLVNPRNLKRRRLGSTEGRISLLHAIAHIEFNAIDLAADMVARFAMDSRINSENRLEFTSDWISVCNDEARHFSQITTRLNELDASYGDLPAHRGLWDAALSTKSDIAARLVLAPMVLEARGLDVTPKMIDNLQKFGDHRSALILTTILNEEIGHVAAGARWFKHICENEKRLENVYFRELLALHFKGSLKPPFNVEARNLAGLSRLFYEPAHVES